MELNALTACPSVTDQMLMLSAEQVIERVQAYANAADGDAKIFWVLPLVEDSASKGRAHLGAAVSRYEMLAERLGPGRVGLLHGRMSAAEKNAMLAQFAAAANSNDHAPNGHDAASASGSISSDATATGSSTDRATSPRMNVLVATTIIESGIDIPQATVCVIENAESFGLSQLHQIRGRVGRSHDPHPDDASANMSLSPNVERVTAMHSSSSNSNSNSHASSSQGAKRAAAKQCHCVLLYDSKASADALKRLQVMKNTTDGFAVAEEDLRIRGPGELLGKPYTCLYMHGCNAYHYT